MSMNPQIKERWVEDLRSGKYEQGDSYLFRKINNPEDSTELSYCCLGVLCTLHMQEFNGSLENEDMSSPSYLDHNFYLPQEVQEWAGLTDGPGSPPLPGVRPAACAKHRHS